MIALAVGALGVVFGDIGTSPLYTLRECMAHITKETGAPPTSGDVLDVLSLIFWSLMLVVTIKYLVFIMKLDNKGEGGVFALLALLPERMRASKTHAVSFAAFLVLVGAACLYGDGAITPAITVLGAVEGIAVLSSDMEDAIVPIALAIIIGLFLIQRRGSETLGKLFGPVMIVWFSVLAVLGVIQIVKYPGVLEALSPHHAVLYFQHHGVYGIAILGAVVLAVTGGEALYADMGHFGLKPIRRGWLLFVLPSLVLCYFGQGALLLRDPSAIENPFFHMVPQGALTVGLIVLSSMASVIASQALISGAFSLTKQAMQLGYFPRVTIVHTSDEEKGQIYVPEVNAALAIVCVLLVVTFGSSVKLAAAYGIAVTLTMTITSLVWYIVVTRVRGWSRAKAAPLLLLFLAFDIPFVIGNAHKIQDGGWVPILIGVVVVFTMIVWRLGRLTAAKLYLAKYPKFEEAWTHVQKHIFARTPGTAVFMASSPEGMPPILVHHVERTRALSETVVLLTVMTSDEPKVHQENRYRVEELGHGFWRMSVSYGFTEHPNVPAAIGYATGQKWVPCDLRAMTYYLARERILGHAGGEMNVMLERVFAFLSRNAVNADRYFRIPHKQVIEVGVQIDL